jgi:DnaJ-class molecular chaperone
MPWQRLFEDWAWAQLAPSEFLDCGGGQKMITKLPLIDPGWSPSREQINDTRAKLNEVIDCLNAFEHAYTRASRGLPRVECPACHGGGGSGNSTPQKFVACAQCQGLGFI